MTTRAYRILIHKIDHPRTHCEFTTEGMDDEDCDEKAKRILETEAQKEENVWDHMELIRIDAPAIPEKITKLGEADKKTRMFTK